MQEINESARVNYNENQGNVGFHSSSFKFPNSNPTMSEEVAPRTDQQPADKPPSDLPDAVVGSPFRFAIRQNPQGQPSRPGEIQTNPFDFHGHTNRDAVPAAPSRLIDSVTNKYYEYLALGQAISKGDLQGVIDFLNQRPDAITASIDTYDTPLLKACSCGHVAIVKELLRRMSPEQVLRPTESGFPIPTPLSRAAGNGEIEIAEALVLKNPKLLQIPGIGGQIPVVTAAGSAQTQMACFLYYKTPASALVGYDGYQGTLLLLFAIYYGMLDIALDLFEACPRLAVTKHPFITSSSLPVLAARPDLFLSGCDLGFWERLVYSCIEVKLPNGSESLSSNYQLKSVLLKILHLLPKWIGIDRIYALKGMHQESNKLLRGMAKEVSKMSNEERMNNGFEEAFFCAARFGNKDFLVEMIKSNSEFMWVAQNSSTSNLFLLSVEFRQDKVFNLFYGLDKRRDFLVMETDNSGNGILHKAGMPPPPDKLSKVPGAVLKLQRELQWFKEIERIVPEIERERANNEGMRPQELFQASHEPLRKEAEEWMKYTATSCSLVAALIATVTFQAIFTVPGGTDDISGNPLHLREARFMVFIIADILSFFASCTSVLIFLGILTARYSFDDFLKALPAQMIAGLSILLIAVAAMLVAFSTALFTSLYKTPKLVIPVLPLTCLPTALFVMLQYPLLKEMVSSTFGRGLFNRNTKRWLL